MNGREEEETGGGLLGLLGLGLTPREERPEDDESLSSALASASRCRVRDLWVDSKYYSSPSLASLAEALLPASGLDATLSPDLRMQIMQGLTEGGRLGMLTMGLDMLLALAVRNKDRLAMVWPVVKTALSSILPANAALTKLFSSRTTQLDLVKYAIARSMDLCRRMAHNDAGFEQCLTETLAYLVRADTAFMWELAVLLASELRLLLRFNTSRVRSARAWRPLGQILGMCCLNEEANGVVLETLVAICRSQPPQLTLAAFLHVLGLLGRVFEAREEHGRHGNPAAMVHVTYIHINIICTYTYTKNTHTHLNILT